MSVSTADDVALGLSSEDRNINIIQRLVGCGITKDENRFASFDFHNAERTVFAELKTRRIRHDQYPTTLISADKIAHIEEGKDYYFIWAYVDGMYYLKYDPEVWSTFECKMYRRFDRSDRREFPKPHIFVPCELLKPVTF
jgi:hypothetical protein